MPEILSLVRSSLLRKPVVGLGIVMVPGLSCEHTVSGEQRSNPSAVWEMVPGTSEGFDVPASISTHPPPLSVWSRVGTLITLFTASSKHFLGGQCVGGQLAPLRPTQPSLRPLLGTSLFHRKSRLPGSLPPSWETPVSPQAIGPWALVLRPRNVGTLSAFQLVSLPPFTAGPGAGWAEGAGRRRLALCPAPLPAGRLGRVAAWTSSQAQRGPLWGSSFPEPLC